MRQFWLILGQMDETFWVTGSSGSLSVTWLQRWFLTVHVHKKDFWAYPIEEDQSREVGQKYKGGSLDLKQGYGATAPQKL